MNLSEEKIHRDILLVLSLRSLHIAYTNVMCMLYYTSGIDLEGSCGKYFEKLI